MSEIRVDTITEKTSANGVAIDSVTLKDGNVVVASGNGISFTATSNSADTVVSELFDDYETGYFTPTFVSSGASWTYYAQKGVYTKIGRTVHYHVQVITNSKSGGTNGNQIVLGNLPFTSLNHSSNPVPSQAIGYTYNWEDDTEVGSPINVPLRALISANNDQIALYDAQGSFLVYEDAKNGSATNYIYVGGHYIAA